jgi:hypothetical protein
VIVIFPIAFPGDDRYQAAFAGFVAPKGFRELFIVDIFGDEEVCTKEKYKELGLIELFGDFLIPVFTGLDLMVGPEVDGAVNYLYMKVVAETITYGCVFVGIHDEDFDGMHGGGKGKKIV